MIRLKYLKNAEKFNHKEFIHGSSECEWNENDFENYERDIDISELRTAIDYCKSEKLSVKDGEMLIANKLYELLSFSRREAADARVWAFLGCSFAPDFVLWRFGGSWNLEGEVASNTRARYLGGHPDTKGAGNIAQNLFRYLWWAKEHTKDFDDDQNSYMRGYLFNQNYYGIMQKQRFVRVPALLKAYIDMTLLDWQDWEMSYNGSKNRWVKGSPMPDTIGKNRDIDVKRQFTRELNIFGSTLVFEGLNYKRASEVANLIRNELIKDLKKSCNLKIGN